MFFHLFHSDQLVALSSVAATMRELEVVDVGGVSTFSQGNDVIYRWAEGVGIFQAEVHRLATDSTHGLRCVDPLLILLKLCPVRSVLIGPVACCHIYHRSKRPGWDRSLTKAVNERRKHYEVTKHATRTDQHRSCTGEVSSDHNADFTSPLVCDSISAGLIDHF